jgi:hypothetical protein
MEIKEVGYKVVCRLQLTPTPKGSCENGYGNSDCINLEIRDQLRDSLLPSPERLLSTELIN